jgi:dCMP deaminase
MKRKDYLKWNNYFMEVAELSAKRSKDPNTQVGCCIVNPKDNHILSIGYNGLPHGFDDDEFEWSDSKEFMDSKHTYVVHAEANAILNSSQSLEGSHVYVSMFPCNECAKLLAQSKVKKVIYKDDKYLHKEKGKAAKIIFDKAGIAIEQYKEEV